MAKGLTEDEMKWILSVDASQAQQEIRKLVKTNRELVNVNKERRQELIKLEAAGKKETEEYKNLEAEIKKTSQSISKNNLKIGELEKKLDITGLSMVQLKKKARDLQRQLDQTVQSANPEEYQALQNELDRVRGRMDELRTAGRHVQNEMSYTEKAVSKVTVAMKLFVAVKLWQYLKDIGKQAYDTRKEFATYEAVLKNATGSTKAAASAMKMIQTLAADTPASVAEWTQAYIKLINRGITPTKDELIQMGDIASSQGKDIDQFIEALLDAMTGENERLKEFGITASKNGETTAFTFRGVTTEVQNTDQAIKNYILSLGNMQGIQGAMATQMEELAGLESNLGDQMDSIYNKIGKKLEPAIKSFMGTLGSLMGTLSSSLDTSAEKFDIQMDKVVSLETDLVPLLDRYDELKTKTNLSAQEQEEMNTLIGRISQIIPSAITGFNNYGQAISVSTSYAREWIKTEKARLAYLNRSQIEQAQKDKESIEEKLALIAKQEEISKRLYGTDEQGQAKSIAVYTGARGFGSNAEAMNYRRASVKEQSEFRKQQQELLNQLAGINAQLDNLQGTTLDDLIKNNTEMINKRREFNEMNKQQLDAWITDEKNANSQYLELAKELRKTRFPEISGNGTDEEARLKEQEKKVKEALDHQSELYNQQQIELKKRYLSGNDEQLQTQTQFNKAMEELLLQDLNARLGIFGLEKEQRQQLEQQILDIRIKAMEDFYKKKAELESQETSLKRQSNEEAMAQNDEWMSQQMKKLQDDHQKRTQIIQQSLQAQVGQYQEYGSQIGNALGMLFTDQENRMENFGSAMIGVLFDVLEAFIKTQITQLIASGIASTGKATAESMATPQSALTFGAAGSATAAILTGLITAAVAAGKAALNGLLHKDDAVTTSSDGNTYYTRVPGKASGGYIDVTRAQDGRKYTAELNPFLRGFVSRPTVIVGEGPAGMSREWVASNDAVNNPTVAPILSILDAAQQAGTIRTLDLNKYIQATLIGRKEGGNISPDVSVRPPLNIDNKIQNLLKSLDDTLLKLQSEGLQAYTTIDDFEAKLKLRNKSLKIGSKS